jgi:hypothetical protein
VTCNPTVMSGVVSAENPTNLGIFRHVRRPSFTSVHGVSVVHLWSVLGRSNKPAGAAFFLDHPTSLMRAGLAQCQLALLGVNATLSCIGLPWRNVVPFDVAFLAAMAGWVRGELGAEVADDHPGDSPCVRRTLPQGWLMPARAGGLRRQCEVRIWAWAWLKSTPDRLQSQVC